MTTNMSQVNEELVMLAEGVDALRQALAAAGLTYAEVRCAEEYQRMLDAAQRVADAAGLAGSDRRAFLSYMDTRTRADVLAEATARRDQDVTFASRQVAEWKRTAGARGHSLPRGLHQFTDS